jgi:hypothetical protein
MVAPQQPTTTHRSRLIIQRKPDRFGVHGQRRTHAIGVCATCLIVNSVIITIVTLITIAIVLANTLVEIALVQKVVIIKIDKLHRNTRHHTAHTLPTRSHLTRINTVQLVDVVHRRLAAHPRHAHAPVVERDVIDDANLCVHIASPHRITSTPRVPIACRRRD